ncbi:riboflavin synthase [Candidatus Marinimicrobia bacterium]|jgi:riboflavin synthase|nr:riboflavin synthase [Candidatus Neomarinimicrobiota bacterium]|tara:strand:+ start:1867 stop:2466 length:600 start_codon:yes stop_codon:yes gene_type:complete
MFTGLVEETGTISGIIKNADGLELRIKASKVRSDLKVNDSISCSGICLTVTNLEEDYFNVQLVNETLDRTNAKLWKIGDLINLERALLPTSRMGGHIVQGHIDTISKVKKIIINEKSAVWEFELNNKIKKYIVEKGSICLDGISLTIANKFENSFSVALIPHTISVTSWKEKKIGDFINVEVDILGKYLESIMGAKNDI